MDDAAAAADDDGGGGDGGGEELCGRWLLRRFCRCRRRRGLGVVVSRAEELSG